MSFLIPENKVRLQATAFVSYEEIVNVGSDNIIKRSAEELADLALRKILTDCIREEIRTEPYECVVLHLDAYVLNRDELINLLVDARKQGERDALRWMPR